MPEPSASARIVLTTAADPEQARRMARALVEERLAACATLIPSAQSIYRWQGEVETATETLVLIKTEAEQLASLETRLRALHSYQTPEFLVLAVDSGTRDYLGWLHSNLKQS